MASNDIVTNDEDAYNKEYRRLKTLTSQSDIVETSVSSLCFVYVRVGIRQFAQHKQKHVEFHQIRLQRERFTLFVCKLEINETHLYHNHLHLQRCCLRIFFA